ncbi:MAG TPA: SUMF1/EgtB/PvdO family nonheme iron enzyme [Anaerolineae bacterium]|nr:SUMF1/EgtB/PvdO family nonheme iron enzyme [Anaerolineae bacterium]
MTAQSTPKRPYASRPTTQMAIGCFAIPLMVVIFISGAFFYLRTNASTQLLVPQGEVSEVRAAPEDAAPLLARYAAGRSLEITGRSEDWSWLEVNIWDGQRGWVRRPLDTLVWQFSAPVATPAEFTPAETTAVEPVLEEMIPIPASSYTMGSPPGLGEPDEEPAHKVNLFAFEIDRTEVTIGQYWVCVAAEACAAPTSDGILNEPHYLNNPAFDNYPIVNLTWEEANNYCQWRGKRLPTEAEWELVAGWNIDKSAKLLWPWGNEAGQAEINAGPTTQAGPVAVGSFPEDVSPFGVLDMGGNVSEWVFDWYKVDYYSVADDTNPMGPSHRRGEGVGRVVRGGAFSDPIEEARTANRRHQVEDYGYPTIGFRCARNN